MQLKELTIKNHPPFEDRKMVFRKGLNVIVGCNGSGKSLLFNLMKQRLKTMHGEPSYEIPAMTKDCVLSMEGKKTAAPIDGYIFLNDDSNDEILREDFMKTEVLSKDEAFKRRFEDEINSLLGRIGPISYFHKVKLHKNIRLHFIDKDGKEKIGGSSRGEKKILAIAYILALRNIKGIDDMMVIDDFAASLDAYNTDRILKLMIDNVPQLIIFSREHELKDTHINPDYTLSGHDGCMIIRRSGD